MDGSPDSINSPWQLTGPDGYRRDGTGDETLTGRAPGEYTLTWGAVAGWSVPDPSSETQTVADGGTITFSGTYTEQTIPLGAIAVDAAPDSIDAPWQLTGPDGYSREGMGDEMLLDPAPGDYTITWGAVSGYDGPSPGSETKAVTADATTTFEGDYTLVAGEVALDLTNVDLGQSGYVRIADDPGLEPQVFTLEAWITPEGAGFGGADIYRNIIIGKSIEGQTGVNLGSWSMTWSAVNEAVYFSVVHQANSSQAANVRTPDGAVPAGSTVHVAGTFDGNSLVLYVDGSLVGTADFSWDGVYYGDDDVLIGAGNFALGFYRRFDGVIDDVRIWDHARSAEQVAANMSCRLTGDETGLLAYWGFETGTLVDDSGNGHDGVAEDTGGNVSFVVPRATLPGCPPR